MKDWHFPDDPRFKRDWLIIHKESHKARCGLAFEGHRFSSEITSIGNLKPVFRFVFDLAALVNFLFVSLAL